MKDKYLEVNKKSWDAIVDEHYNSEFYDVKNFLKGKTSLNQIELDLLGNIAGKKVLHLQCHFGQDSISLARMGADVTAIDFSEKAIDKAKKLSELAKQQVNFICCDVYKSPEILDEKFDIIFTSYGVIGWLPSMNKWAKLISHFLHKNGRLVFAEFHPVVWMFDNDFTKIQYNYFKDGEIVETESGTYTNHDAEITREMITWNHGLSEVFTALLEANLTITQFQEFDFSPYDCLKGLEEFEPKKFRIKHLGNKIPMVYALEAVKK